MAKRCFLGAFLSVTLLGVSIDVWAVTFVVPLETTGPYMRCGQKTSFEFDLGVALSEVHEVRFVCEGTITAGINYGGKPFSWFFEAWLPAEPGYWWVAHGPSAGEATWPVPEPFAGESEFRPLWEGTTWDFLLDGRAAGWVELATLYIIPEFPPQQEPFGFLEAASLIIEVTPAGQIGDFCGANFGPSDGYVDVWDLMQFANQWHTSSSDTNNWDSKFDLAGPNFGPPDGYIDVWDLMVFADHWHEGEKP